MIKEKDIILNLRHRLIKRYWDDKDGFIWTTNEIVSFAAAFVYPYVDEIFSLEDEIKKERNSIAIDALKKLGTIKDFKALISKIVKKEKKVKLNLLSRTALEQYFREKFSDTSTELSKVFVGQLPFMCLKPDNTIAFTAAEAFLKYVADNKPHPYLHPEYGIDDLPPFESVTITSVTADDVMATKKKIGVRLTKVEIDNSAIQTLWNTIPISPELIKKPYFWENKLSTTYYEALSKALDSFCSGKDKKTMHEYIKIKECALIFAFYIAEWYKRDYQTENPEPPIIKSVFADDIWESLGVEDHRSVFYDLRYSSNNQAHLYSLGVLGGLPLNISSDRQKGFINFMLDLCSNNNEIDEDDINKHTQGVAVRESILRRSSIYEYFQRLYCKDFPWAAEDESLPIFQNFMNLLEESRQQDIFSAHWIYYYDHTDSYLNRKLAISHRHSPKQYFSYESLKKLGIPTNIQCFDLYVGFNGETETQIKLRNNAPIHYSNTYNGGFLNWEYGEYTILRDIPNVNISSIEFYMTYFDGNENTPFKRVNKPIKLHAYVQLYKTNRAFEWSQKQGDRGVSYYKSAVVYSIPWYPAEETIVDKKIALSENYIVRFHEIDEQFFSLTNDDEKVLFAGSPNKLKIFFKRIDDIDYKFGEEPDVVCYVDGERKIMPLMYGIDGIDQSKFVDKNGNETETECEYYYVLNDSQRLLSPNNPPQEGIVELLAVDKKDQTKKKSLTVFYLDKGSISRNLEQKAISFNSNLNVWINDVNDLNWNQEKKTCFDLTKNLGFHHITFRIGADNDNYCELSLYRPRNLDVVVVDGLKHYYPQSKTAQFNHRQIQIQKILLRRTKIWDLGDKCIIEYPEKLAQNYTINLYRTNSNGADMSIDYHNERKLFSIQSNISGKEESVKEYRFFYYSYVKDKLSELPIEYHRTGDRVYFDANPKASCGVVFQSLKEVSPRYYYKHICFGNVDKNADADLFIKFLLLANEHRIYFRTFAPLASLLKGEGFYLAKKRTPKEPNYFIENFIKEVIDKINNQELSYNMYRVLIQFMNEGNQGDEHLKKARKLVEKYTKNKNIINKI